MNKTLGAIIAATVLSTACAKAPQRPDTPRHAQVAGLDSDMATFPKQVAARDFLINPQDTENILMWYERLHLQAQDICDEIDYVKSTSEWKAEDSALARYQTDSTLHADHVFANEAGIRGAINCILVAGAGIMAALYGLRRTKGGTIGDSR